MAHKAHHSKRRLAGLAVASTLVLRPRLAAFGLLQRFDEFGRVGVVR